MKQKGIKLVDIILDVVIYTIGFFMGFMTAYQFFVNNMLITIGGV